MADNDYMSTQEVLTGIKTWVKKEIGTNIYDISANHNGAKYADLSAALGTNGANIPQSLRKGGMSVKYVQSSDNKYVQYRLMADAWSTVVTQWQGVDDEPTAGSDNLVKSGGVKKVINNVNSNIAVVLPQDLWYFANPSQYTENRHLDENGNEVADPSSAFSGFINVELLKTAEYKLRKIDTGNIVIAAYDENKNLLLNESVIYASGTGSSGTISGVYTKGTNTVYIRVLKYKGTIPDHYIMPIVNYVTKEAQTFSESEKMQIRENIGVNNEFLANNIPLEATSIYEILSKYTDANGNTRSYGTYRRIVFENKGYSKISALCGNKRNESLGVVFVAFYNGTPSSTTFMSAASSTPVYTNVGYSQQVVNVPSEAKYIAVCTQNDDNYPFKVYLFNTTIYLLDVDKRVSEVEQNIINNDLQIRKAESDIGFLGVSNKRGGLNYISSSFSDVLFPFSKREVTGKRIGAKPIISNVLGDVNTSDLQGAAIYENILFVTCSGNYGHVAFVDMRTGEVIQFSPNLIKTTSARHNNQAFFGTEKYDDNDYFPLLYISGQDDSIGCIDVYRISGDYGSWSMQVVQTIALPQPTDSNYDIKNAEISINNGVLIALGYKNSTYTSTIANNTTRIANLGTLPPLSVGNTTITTIVDAWDLPSNLSYYQGNIIQNNIMYITFGWKLAAIDLVNKTMEINQLPISDTETEALFIYRGELYMTCFANVGVYKDTKVAQIYYLEFIKE